MERPNTFWGDDIMEKRKWETPKTLTLGELSKAVGDCVDGSTAIVYGSAGCGEGSTPITFVEECLSGGAAAGGCSMGQQPDLAPE